MRRRLSRAGVGYGPLSGAAAAVSRAGVGTCRRRRSAGLRAGRAGNDRLGFGVEVEFRHDQLPCLYQWQNFHAGSYALGIEPSTHHVLGNNAARARNEMIWLDAGEERPYLLTIRVLPDADATDAASRRIAGIAAQPSDPYPEPSGRFPPLAGRARPGAEPPARETTDQR